MRLGHETWSDATESRRLMAYRLNKTGREKFVIRTATVTCVAALFCVTLFFVFSGCRGEAKPPSGELVGKVLSNGELVGDCVVAIYNPTTKKSMGAKVDAQGEFTIPEIPLGEYKVTVSQMPSSSAKNPPFDKRIPKEYRNRKTTDLKVEIKEGENLQDFKMKR